MSSLQKLIVGYFTGGNLIVRIGVVVLFFGLSFLAKFSIDNGLIPVEWRLGAIGLMASCLLAFGFRLRKKAPGYALVLQGAGIAALYLVVFSALRLYQLLPATFAFGLLLLISVLALLLAVAQNSRALAVTAIAGAFACPILTSDGSGSHIALFSYYALLNFTVFAIAWFKSWRLLNLIAFAFTFLVATAWGVLRYEHDLYHSTQWFLILFVLQFVAIAVLFAWRQPPQLRGLVDGTLIFGIPLIGFGLQAALVEPVEYGLAYSAVVIGAFYLLLGVVIFWLSRPAMRLLAESFLALGLIFCTLAIPLAFDASWTSAAWAIEGAAFAWLAQRQKKLPLLLFGYLLQAGALAFYLYDIEQAGFTYNNTTLLGNCIIAIAAVVTAWLTATGKLAMLHKALIAASFMVYGLVIWYAGVAIHIVELLRGRDEHIALVSFITLSGLAGGLCHRRINQPVFNQLPWLTTILLALVLFTWPVIESAISWAGIVGLWLAALAIHYFVLYRSRDPLRIRASDTLHAASWLLATGVVVTAANALMQQFGQAEAYRFAMAAIVLVTALVLPVLRRHWPFETHANAFRTIAPTVLLAALLLWTVINVSTVLAPSPLPYLPMLNPMDLAQLASIAGFWIWRRAARTAGTHSEADKNWTLGAGLVGFAWCTSLLLKTLHVWQEIPYTAADLFYSPTVQTSLSIFWTIVGLAAAVYATRYHRRIVWFCAAALLAVVVAKLFLIDLTEQDSLTRIASFVGVGGLLLVVGYFAPLPPAQTTSEDESA